MINHLKTHRKYMQKIIFLSIGILSLVCTNTMEINLLPSTNLITGKYNICILVQDPVLSLVQDMNKTNTFTQSRINLLTGDFPEVDKVLTILKNYSEILSPFKITMQPNITKIDNDLALCVKYQKKCWEKLTQIKKALQAYIFTKPASRPPREFHEDQGIIAMIMNPILGLCHYTLYQETPIEEVIENTNTFSIHHIVIERNTQNNPAQESPIQKERLHFIAKGLTLATIDQTGNIKTIVAHYPFKKDDEDLSLLEIMTIIARLATLQPY